MKYRRRNKSSGDGSWGCGIIILIAISIIWIQNHWQSFLIVLAISIIIYLIYWIIKDNKRIKEGKITLQREQEAKEKAIELEKQKQEFERQQIANGLVKYKDKWGNPEQVKRWKEIDIDLDNNFSSLSPYDFEKFIAALFEKMGYETKTTPSSGDYGADVIATKGNEITIIECKRYSRGTHVTPEEVQRTLGAIWKYKANKAIFITTSQFSTRAAKLEKEAPIELWNKEKLHQIVRKYYIDENK